MKNIILSSFKLISGIICALSVLVSFPLKGAEGLASDTSLANSYYTNAKAFVDLGQLDSAIFYYEKSAKIFNQYALNEKYAACLNYLSEQYVHLGQLEKADNYAHQALQTALKDSLFHEAGKSYNNIAVILSQRGLLDSAAVYFEKALSVWLPLDGEEHLRIAVIFTNLGYMYQISGDYEKALNSTNRAIDILNVLDEEVDEYLAYNYNSLGTLYTAKGLNTEAISLFEKALQLWISTYGENHPIMTTFYINVGEVYRKNGDYKQALLYLNKALSIFKQLGVELPQLVATCYTNTGSIYLATGDYDKALNAYIKAGSIWSEMSDQPYNLATIKNNISNVFLYKNEYDTAIIYLKEAINILTNSFPDGHPDLGAYYTNLGKNYFYKKDYDRATDAYEKATRLFLNLFGEKHPKLAACYTHYGKLFMAQQQHRRAIEYFQKSIIANIKEFDNANIFVNPELEDILSKTILVYSLEDKAKAFYELFRETPDSILFLEAALNTGDIAIQLIDVIRKEYKSEGSKFFLNKEFADVYTNTLNYSLELYEITGDQKYFNKAFEIAEKSRAAVLFASILELDAKTIGGIPDSLQKAARVLKHDIVFYDQKIKEEYNKENPDELKLSKWQQIHFATLKSYDSLIVSFENDYHDYFDLKYNLNVAGIQSVQKYLSKHEALIEYVLTDTIMITFVITENNSDLYISSIDSTFHLQIDGLRKSLISKDFSDASVHEYCAIAHNLYLQLIGPLEGLPDGMTLIIIPDGKLATIPFEALLSSEVTDRERNSSNFPYLIKQYAISYGNSATLLLNSFQKNNNPDYRSVLAFAPSFQTDHKELLAELKERGEEFVSLSGAKDEVTLITNFTGGELYLDAQASEANFKRLTPDYQVLHIATHGIINDKDPMMSRLAFSTENDSIEDGSLYVYELYSLKLNADMAVLSACNTGYGKLQEGEGVMSLARAFLYAGVPSIVMSQWSVNDKSSAELMVSFYEQLNSGLSKAKAMQKAKLDYLHNADNLTAHPYYWAGFVIIGNQGPVNFSSAMWYWWLLLIPVVLLWWLWFRKRFN